MTGTNPRVAPDLVRHHAPKLADLTDLTDDGLGIPFEDDDASLQDTFAGSGP
jgi:hypothetical protein